MHYLALVCDYDGTLAKDGKVSQQTIAALERVVGSGRKLLLASGRMLKDLQGAFPRLDLFAYSKAVGQTPPKIASSASESGEVLVWFRHSKRLPMYERPRPSKEEHLRHRRKYAQGDLGPDGFCKFYVCIGICERKVYT